MKTYQINMNGYVGTVPCPDVLPVRGQVLTVVEPFRTLADLDYPVGHKLTLMWRTDEAPHGRSSSLGAWVVDCGYQVSVWTNIEWMLADGRIV